MPQSFAVGQAPWETQSAPSGGFPVGQAPWETNTAPVPLPATPTAQPNMLQKAAGGAYDFLKGAISPFASIAATPVQFAAKGLGLPDPYANNQAGLHISPLNLEQKAGDVLQAGATTAAIGAAPATIGGAALAGAGIGAAQFGGSALQQQQSAPEVAKQALIGGAVGGVTGGAFQGLGKVLSSLPNRLVKNALPKLSNGNEQYVLNSTKLGPIKNMLTDSSASVSNLGQQVQSILTHPEYAADTGAGNFALEKTLNAFPNSAYTVPQIISTIKQLVPAQAKLVDQVANGTATLVQKNQLRASIDPIIKKVFTDAPQVTAKKQIGAEFANALRGEVQSYAPETQPIFANMSKEIDLRNALFAADKKLATKSALSLYDIVAGLGGFTTLGPAGAVGAIVAEKAFRSPAVGVAAAKGLQASLPALNALPQASRLAIPAIGTALNQNAQTRPPLAQPSSQSISPQSSPNPTTSPQSVQLDPFVKRLAQELPKTGGPVGALEKTGSSMAGAVLSRIHPQDVHVMQKFITAARGGEGVSQSMDIAAQHLAEYWNLNVNKSAKLLANKFEDILAGKLKVKSTNLGKFSPK